MAKYTSLANAIVDNVGGVNNIINVVHCFTRLRFELKDKSKANDEALKGIEGVLGVKKAGGLYQIVIGSHVEQVYKELIKIEGVLQGSADSSTSEDREKKSISAKIIGYISGSFSPIIPMLAAGGMIKGLILIIDLLIYAFTGSESTFRFNETATYLLLENTAFAIFAFFPVVLGFNAARKLGMNPYIGLAIGALLMHPGLQGLEGDYYFLGVINFENLDYVGTVIPIMLVMPLAAPLEKWLNSVIADVAKPFLVPAIVLLIVAPIAFVAIGPVANMASDGLFDALDAIIDFNFILAAVVLALVWQTLVIFGVHHPIKALFLVQVGMAGQSSPLLGVAMLAAITMGAVTFGIWLKTKNKATKDLTLSTWIAGLFGITEPAIYGVTLPNPKFFGLGVAGAVVGALWMGIMDVQMYNFGMGVFTIFGYIEGGAANVLNYLIAMGAGVTVAVVGGFILWKDKDVQLATPEAATIPAKTTVDNTTEVEESVDLEAMSLTALKALAKEKGLSGYSNLKKPEIIELIKKA